jgi:biotin synthase
MKHKEQIETLYRTGDLPDEALLALIRDADEEDRDLLAQYAREVRQRIYGTDVYLRGLIEFSNYCKNDCYYCGIRRSNRSADRYRLSEDEILRCADEGHRLGFRTFVLQSGEDPFFHDGKDMPSCIQD